MLKFWKRFDRWTCTLSVVILTIGTLLYNSAHAEEMQKIQELTISPPLSTPFDLPLRNSDLLTRTSAIAKGKPYLLHLWAVWCGPCRMELPRLASFLDKNPDIPIIPVALDSGAPEHISIFTQHLKLQHFPIWAGDKGVLQKALLPIGDPGLPVTLLVDGHGQIRTVSDGGLDWSASDAKKEVQKLLSEVK